MKLDIEGAELLALKSLENHVNRLWLVQTEINFIPYRTGQATVEEIYSFFTENGFIFLKEIDSGEYRYNGMSKFENETVSFKDYFSHDSPYSKGVKCSADWIFIKSPDLINKKDLEDYINLCIKYEIYDLALELCDKNIPDFKSKISFIKKASKKKFITRYFKGIPIKFYNYFIQRLFIFYSWLTTK